MRVGERENFVPHATKDRVDQRATGPTSIEAELSQSSTLSLAHRRRDPRDRSKQLLDASQRSRNRVHRSCVPSNVCSTATSAQRLYRLARFYDNLGLCEYVHRDAGLNGSQHSSR
jgi:hypothetical protein